MARYKMMANYMNKIFNEIEKFAEKNPSLTRMYYNQIKKARTIEEVVKQCSEIKKAISYDIKKQKENGLMEVKEIENSIKKPDNIKFNNKRF